MGALGKNEDTSAASVSSSAAIAVSLDDSDGCFSLDSPRSVEACRRRGVDESDLEEGSVESFVRQHSHHRRHAGRRWRGRPTSRSGAEPRDPGFDGHGGGDATPAIRKERHEINRHRLLREVIISHASLRGASL